MTKYQAYQAMGLLWVIVARGSDVAWLPAAAAVIACVNFTLSLYWALKE